MFFLMFVYTAIYYDTTFASILWKKQWVDHISMGIQMVTSEIRK